MADKEMGIIAKLNIDEVLSGLDDLIGRLSQIPDSVATQLQVDGIDELEESAQNAEVSLEQVQEAAGMVGTDLSGIDTSSLEDVSGAASAAADDISSVGDSADGIDLSLQSIGEAASHAGSGISGISEKMNDTKEKTEEASGATNELAEGFGMVEGVVSALVGVGLAAWIESITDAAGNFQDSWLRLTLAMGGSTDEIDVYKDKYNSAINEMKDNTGRRAGVIREFITQMGISGVQSSDTIVKAFDAIAGTDFILNGGKNIEGVANAFENVIRQPTRVVGALRTMGITTDDIMKSTGLTTQELTEKFKGMSVEQRALFLSNIMDAKYGAEANEGYKQSWEHVKDQLGAAWDYISRIIGGLILPLVVPVMEFLTDLLSNVAGAIDDLNPTIKSIAGIILLFGGALTSIWLIISPIISLISGPLLTSLGGFIGLLTGTAEASGLLAGVLSGPVGWAILAIIAAVASAIYLWQNWSDEIIQLKDNLLSGNWGAAASQIGGAFQYIGPIIYNALVYAGQVIWNFFANLPAMIGNFAGWYYDMGSQIIQWILTGLMSLSGMLEDVLIGLLENMAESGGDSGESTGKQAGEKTGNGLVDGFIQFINTKGPVILNTLQILFMKILPLLVNIIIMIMAIVAIYMYNWGRAAGVKLVTGIINYVRTLPARLLALMLSAALSILRFAAQGYSYARSAGSRIVSGITSALVSLPGKMYTWGKNSINRFINAIIDSIPGLRAALNEVRALFPSSPPKAGPLSKITTKNMYDWMKTIATAGIEGFSSFNINDIALPAEAAVEISGGTSNTSKTSLSVVIKKGAVQILGNATKDVIEGAGSILGESIADGAIRNGVNTRIDLQ